MNRDFEHRSLNMGFDWRFVDHSPITLSFDAQQFHSGPGFFVNGIPLSGAQSQESFAKVIDEELARVERPQRLNHRSPVASAR